MKTGEASLSKSRLFIVNLAILLFIAGSLFDIAAGMEHWPFSSYQMYARVREERGITRPRLFGVTKEDPPREIPLYESRTLHPFDKSRLARAFTRMGRMPRREALFREALRDRLKRYEALRLAGRHEGPPLRGMRLYELYWELDPWARNKDKPTRRTLLAEVSE